MSLDLAGRFPRRAEALPQVFTLVETFLAGGGAGEDQRFLLDFALEELFTNTVKYNPSGGGEISIQLRARDGELRISVTDPDADRFDPTTDAPPVDPTLPLEARTPGGLGIHLLKGLADRIEYEYQDRVSTIHLFKKLE